MKVPLKTNWEFLDSKLNHRPSNLGPRHRNVVDRTFDGLHNEGKMKWSANPTPFDSPVFVSDRFLSVVSKKIRERMIIDVRGLNKVAETDAYPLPLHFTDC